MCSIEDLYFIFTLIVKKQYDYNALDEGIKKLIGRFDELVSSVYNVKYTTKDDIKNAVGKLIPLHDELYVFLDKNAKLYDQFIEKIKLDFGDTLTSLRKLVNNLTILNYYKKLLHEFFDVLDNIKKLYSVTFNERSDCIKKYTSDTNLEKLFLQQNSSFFEELKLSSNDLFAFTFITLIYLHYPNNFSDESSMYLIERVYFSLLYSLKLEKRMLKDILKVDTLEFQFLDENPDGKYSVFSEDEVKEAQQYFLSNLYERLDTKINV